MSELLLLILALITSSTVAVALYLNEKVTKFIMITMIIILANTTYFALNGVKGWPAQEQTDVKGTLASVVIVNPSKVSKGSIYIGVFLDKEPIWFEYKYPRYAPKTFYIEYSNNRAALFDKAKKALEKGKKVKINGIPPKEPKQGEGEGSENGSLDLGNIGSYLSDLANQFGPKEKDTYNPEPDIQIEEDQYPPSKGPTQ